MKKTKSKKIKTDETKGQEYVGILDHISPSLGYLIVEGEEKDIKLKGVDTAGAFHGDTLKIQVQNGKPIIKSIIKRAKEQFIGTIIKKYGNTKDIKNDKSSVSSKNCSAKSNLKSFDYFIKLDGKKYHYLIDLINLDSNIKFDEDHKALVKIVKWPYRYDSAKAEIIKIFGKSGEHDTEIDSVIYAHDLSTEFDQKIINEVEKTSTKISKNEISHRKDFRNILTVTIDPENAKDFDDALSLHILDNGNYEIGVHIADASFYVPENSLLDKEALKRGNSTYLVDRTIPMLPPKLSNDICSLKPNEDRLTFSITFEIDNHANIKNFWLGEGIIHSKKRFVYEEAQQILDNKKGLYYNELNILNDTAKKLRTKRFKNGSIYFSTPDFYVKLDELNNPINISKKKEIATNYLIEEFMLLANKKVASKISKLVEKKKNINFIYRVHDKPDPLKLSELEQFLKIFKYKFNPHSKNLPELFNTLAKDFKDRPEFTIIQYFAIRTMAKAIYSEKNISHFGLGFSHYTHFTSPIRRYSDLEVHRLLKKYLLKRYEDSKFIKKNYKEICNKISLTERNSIDAERASIKFKQILYLQSQKNKILVGMITYITEKLFFVEIENTGCEGIVLYEDIKGDYYELDKNKFFVIGKRKRKKFQIGDIINVKVKECNIEKKTCYFSLETNSESIEKK